MALTDHLVQCPQARGNTKVRRGSATSPGSHTLSTEGFVPKLKMSSWLFSLYHASFHYFMNMPGVRHKNHKNLLMGFLFFFFANPPENQRRVKGNLIQKSKKGS